MMIKRRIYICHWVLEESYWVRHGMLFKKRYGNKRTVEDITRAAVALLNADVEEETNHRKASVQILEFVVKRGSQVYS